MRELIVTGKTVEEAVESALEQLGLIEEEVTVEVLELPRKKLFRTVPARVKVIVDADVQKEAEKAAKAAKTASAAKKAEVKKETSAQKEPVKAAKAPEKQVNTADKKEQKETAPQKKSDFDKEGVPQDIASSERLSKAADYVREIGTYLGVPQMEITAMAYGENVVFKIEGENTGNLIGHRGETMDSIGYLANLVANRSGDDYMRLSLDVNNYRQKREANLTQLAKRIGAKVAKTGKSQTLEPMNPYERRILHSAIGEIDGVKSESVGEGATRRVCVLPENENAKQSASSYKPRGGRQGSRNGQRQGGGPRQAPRFGADGQKQQSSTPARNFADKPRNTDAQPTAQKRTKAVNDGENLPLYGKIEV